jgi:ribosome-binding protein aMBF1 (putative translation factor)
MVEMSDNTDLVIDRLMAKITTEIQDDANYKTKLAAKIYAGIKAKGWNRTEFALQMKKKNSVITKWLNGYHNFETDTLREIEKVLGINLLNLEIEEDEITVKTTVVKASVNAQSTDNFSLIDFDGGRVANHWEVKERLEKVK